MKETSQYSQKQIKALENAYNFFNEHLFNNRLSPCMLTISQSYKAGGIAVFSKWKDTTNSNQKIHEITICNPFFEYEPLFGYSILVHEMVHVWQFEYGDSGKNGYHNKEWGWKMKEIGLIPSHTGQEGGKETGEKMSHYIEIGGQFEKVFSKMPKKCLLPFSISRQTVLKKATKGASIINDNKKPYNPTKRNRSKKTYTCENCGMKVWGRSNLKIKCVKCDTLLLIVAKK